jgi:hypothetical protein
MASITGANSVVMLAIAALYPVAQQLQGFAADDVFDSEGIASAEILTGVDGNMSAGWVYVPIKQGYTLQADSASNALFEAWYQAQQAIQELYFASATIHLPATSRSYVMTKGVLTLHKPTPDVKKVLQPRKYEITWSKIFAGPL